ncbi:unnamed protein product, partial [Closterium sp. NIES-64]
YIAEKAGTARHRPATNAPFIFNIKTVGGMILLKVKFTDCFVEIAKLVQQWEGKEWVVLSVGPSGKPSPWEGNCSDAIPATLISGQALIGVSAALIGVSAALIGVSAALIGVSAALIGVSAALIGVTAALIGVSGALIGVSVAKVLE